MALRRAVAFAANRALSGSGAVSVSARKFVAQCGAALPASGNAVKAVTCSRGFAAQAAPVEEAEEGRVTQVQALSGLAERTGSSSFLL